MVELVGSSQSGRSCSYHSHLFAVALRHHHLHEVFFESMLRDGSLILAVGCRLVFREVQNARLLTQGRADASCKLRERICGVEQSVSQLPVALIESVVPLRRLIAKRTCPMAERHATIHAARSLHASIITIESLFHLSEIMYSIVYWPVSRFLARYGQKCFWISHFLMFNF